VTLLTIYMTLALAGALLAAWRQPVMPRRWPLLVIAAVPQLSTILGIHIPGGFVLSVAALAAWCLSNHRLAGVRLVALGVAMNLFVMAFHGGLMPIQADILASLGVDATPGTILIGSKDIVVADSPLWFLSDWLVLVMPLVTIVASPGDLVAVGGVIRWLVFSRRLEREQLSMVPLQTTPLTSLQQQPLLPGPSSRPALTRLAVLAAANPTIAENLLRDPVDAACSHPHYALLLDAHDRATLNDIRSRATTVSEFLAGLADVVDGRQA
jgi:hypothetical protein